MRKGSKVVLAVLSVIVLLTVVCAIFISQTGKNLGALSELPMEDIDLSEIPDGTYSSKVILLAIKDALMSARER